MNEKIRQVLDIEKQAHEIQEKAQRDAQEIPVKAEQESQALIARARAEAEDESRKILAAGQSANTAEGISSEAGQKSSQFDASAKKHIDKAVAYVLERVIGRS